MDIKIQPLKSQDFKKVVKIASQSFAGLAELNNAEKWIECNFKAFPRMRYFTAKNNKKILGYILWMEKGGFRKEAVLELEQIAVLPEFRGRGVGTALIEKSLLEIRKAIEKRGSVLKLVEVATGTDNKAQNLYKKTLGAESEAVVKDLYRGDTLIMFARF